MSPKRGSHHFFRDFFIYLDWCFLRHLKNEKETTTHK